MAIGRSHGAVCLPTAIYRRGVNQRWRRPARRDALDRAGRGLDALVDRAAVFQGTVCADRGGCDDVYCAAGDFRALGGTSQSPRSAINTLFEWLALGLGFFLLRQFIAGQREVRAVAAVMVALAAAVACYGLYQAFFELPATRAFYFADPEGALRDLGIPSPAGAAAAALRKPLAEQRADWPPSR